MLVKDFNTKRIDTWWIPLTGQILIAPPQHSLERFRHPKRGDVNPRWSTLLACRALSAVDKVAASAKPHDQHLIGNFEGDVADWQPQRHPGDGFVAIRTRLQLVLDHDEPTLVVGHAKFTGPIHECSVPVRWGAIARNLSYARNAFLARSAVRY